MTWLGLVVAGGIGGFTWLVWSIGWRCGRTDGWAEGIQAREPAPHLPSGALIQGTCPRCGAEIEITA